LLVGIVHGLAGSAAVALLVLGAIEDAALALIYLLLFGLGTIAGMVLITTALAVPVAVAAQRFASFHRVLGVATGLASVAFGGLLVYEIGFVQGLFSPEVHWSAH
jgi:high-affinity nickel-transport protein